MGVGKYRVKRKRGVWHHNYKRRDSRKVTKRVVLNLKQR